jgi:hypothetical protein
MSNNTLSCIDHQVHVICVLYENPPAMSTILWHVLSSPTSPDIGATLSLMVA